ncbi:bifunctional cytidylyltransferase/SDR family oxidoreductase [Nocardioides sp. zg-ZUI104]|uniref:bifunctional cytidylyltransferase/SDR family oxidoreductase n=1 Tax=Nocardioides faecalis TaxID=2803858 RepID=UPI001BD12186|nr:bifunctional cytidylyltransferase/SDR family oxidoreductase [Nocardioides faecalis]MBS4752043.1 bifunctional cytidylyltransferase/SDR family oxidoreductase [Nocardioides faecalis]
MSTPVKNVGVLLAGGVGSRVGLDIPKQLIKVAGKTLLEHTLVALHDHPDVDEVLVMMTPGHTDAVRDIVRKAGFEKVTAILEGGETRNATTQRAIDHLSAQHDPASVRILLHDAVRPLVTPRIIGECFAALADYPAVDVAIPSADTIIEVAPDDTIRSIPPRAALRRGQTPQAFRLDVLARAYELADADPDFTATDDCSVVLRYLPDEPIIVVHGDDRNMKVTEPIDVFIADKLFQLTGIDLPRGRDEAGYAEAFKGKTMVVFGGSYGIGADIAALASSYGATVLSYSRSTTGTDVGRRADIAAAAEDAITKAGSIDFVVNTAGVLPRGSLLETTEETVYAATDINYLGPIFIAQEFYPHLLASKGSLLLFTSSSYTRGRGGYSLYSSAKAATVNLTQALADEWAEDGVRVNCINPERTATPMRTKAFGAEPPGTLLESEAVARTSVDVLLSDQSGHVYDVRKDDPFALD